jgi:hypothetical protein
VLLISWVIWKYFFSRRRGRWWVKLSDNWMDLKVEPDSRTSEVGLSTETQWLQSGALPTQEPANMVNEDVTQDHVHEVLDPVAEVSEAPERSEQIISTH